MQSIRLADPSRLALFPPARWQNRTAVVDLGSLGLHNDARLADHVCDAVEEDLRAIVVRLAPAARVVSAGD